MDAGWMSKSFPLENSIIPNQELPEHTGRQLRRGCSHPPDRTHHAGARALACDAVGLHGEPQRWCTRSGRPAEHLRRRSLRGMPLAVKGKLAGWLEIEGVLGPGSQDWRPGVTCRQLKKPMCICRAVFMFQ